MVSVAAIKDLNERGSGQIDGSDEKDSPGAHRHLTKPVPIAWCSCRRKRPNRSELVREFTDKAQVMIISNQ
jgi:hypothetical protein